MADESVKGEQYEEANVHAVYEQIASHFSATRYKVQFVRDKSTRSVLTLEQPWPIIERFLKGLPDGAVGLDVGCGNGKYLTVNHNIFIVGSDR
jgi:tRNA (uracil-5-)-methyltransferase TRM9